MREFLKVDKTRYRVWLSEEVYIIDRLINILQMISTFEKEEVDKFIELNGIEKINGYSMFTLCIRDGSHGETEQKVYFETVNN